MLPAILLAEFSDNRLLKVCPQTVIHELGLIIRVLKTFQLDWGTDYDKYLCLKPSPGMWLVILFLLRPYIMLASTIHMGPGTSGITGTSVLKEMLYPDDLSLFLGITASIPALLFMIAWVKRKPGAPEFYRKVWHKSALLLVLSAVLSIAIVFLPVLTESVNKLNFIGITQLAISAAIIPYLLLSKHVKETFADYSEDISEN